MMPMCECDHETCPCSRNRRIASVHVMRGNKRLRVCSGCQLTTDETLPVRFIVKPASEMQPSEPCVAFDTWGTAYTCATRLLRDEYRWIPTQNEEDGGVAIKPWDGRIYMYSTKAVCAVVDTHDAWHTTRVEAPPLELPEIAEPAKPTDAEIVEIHGWTLNEIPTPRPGGWTYENGSPSWRDRVYSLRGHRVTRQDREAAWSRELKRKQAEARDKERHQVICEDQYEL